MNLRFRSTASLLLVSLVATFGGLGACSNDGENKGAPSATPSATVATTATATGSTIPTVDTGTPLPDDDGPLPDSTASAGGDEIPAPPEPAPPQPTTEPKTQPKSAAKPDPTPAPKPQDTPKPPPAAPLPAPPAPTPAPVAKKPVELKTPEKGSADEVASKVDAIFKPTKRFKALFNQKYTAKVHGKEKTSKGLVYVEKPGKLSLKYQDPNKNRAVSDGTTLKVYEHENKQMFVKPVKNTEYPGAFAFILGQGLRQSFTFEFHKTSKWEGGPVLVGTPRVANPGYTKVFFYIDSGLLGEGKLGCVRRVLVIDAQGNKNRFDFLKATEPSSIKATRFQFTPPTGTQIIKG